MAGNFDQDFAAALAGLSGSGNFNPLPQATPMQFQPPAQIDYKQLGNAGGAMISPAYSGASKPAGNGLWDGVKGVGTDALRALMGVGNIITDTISSATDGNADTIPLLNWAGLFGQGQANAWTDGKFTLGDVPILGGLIGAGQNGKTTADIMDNFGIKEAEADPSAGWNPFQYRKGNFDIGDIGAFAGDVLLDPLNWVTFGGGSAVKAGAKAAGKTAAELLATHGLEAGLAQGAKRSFLGLGKFGLNIGAPELGSIAEHVGSQIAAKTGEHAGIAARVAIENAGKTARTAAQNALINFDVPFTNITRQFGSKPGFMKIADSVIGEMGKAPVVRKLAELGMDEASQGAFLRTAFKVDDASQMTSQASKHFFENIDKVKRGEDIYNVFKPVTDELMSYHPADPLGILNSVTDSRVRGPVTPAIENMLKNPLMFDGVQTSPQILGNARSFLNPTAADLNMMRDILPEVVGKVGADVKNAYAAFTEPMGKGFAGLGDAFRNLDNTATTAFAPFEKAALKIENPMKTLGNAQDVFSLHRFAQDMGGTSPLSRWIGSKVSALNPRSLGSADQFVNQGADAIKDAENFKRSNIGWTKHEVEQVQKLSQGLPQSDMAKIPYMLEGKAPGGVAMDKFLENVTNKAQLQQVADYLKGMFARQATRESGAGTLTKSIDNYFPHVMNKEGMSKEALQAMLADPEMTKLMGRSSANQFNQARKGFNSFAQWDEAVKGLQDALKVETDPAKIEKLSQALDQIQNLFQRDPIKATASRMDAGIKATSMAQLQTDLRNMGTIRLPDDIAKDGVGALTPDFVRLDAKTAEKLNLPAGTAIHKEVLQGLEKTQNLFTDAGINNFVENATSAMNIWKNLVTTYVPAHHITNLMGNVANTTLAGVKPPSYMTAGKLLSKARKGTMSEVERKFLQEAVDKGVLGGGQLLDVIDPLRFAQQGGKLQKAERYIANTGYAKLLRGVGDKFEDLSRLATYIHGKQVTGSAKLASDMVRKYLFNFGELTNADRVIKLGAPFWTWTKNNLPLQIGEFLRQPRYMLTSKKLQAAMNDSDTLAPDYVQKSYFKIPGTDHSFFNPRIPAQDAFNALDDPLGTLTGMINPFAKVPIELQMNKQMFNGAPIDPTYTPQLGYAPGTVPSYLFKQTGVGAKAANLFDPNANLLDNIMGLLVGKPVTVDPVKESRNQMFQRKADQKALRARAKKAGG